MSLLLKKKDACWLIGMVHLLPLPGSPAWGGSMQAVLDAAMRDAEALVKGGCDALLVENMGDLPYLCGSVGPETVASMALATEKVVKMGLPCGVQVLAAANREALGVALASGASFIRAEGFAYAHIADEGWIEASAGELLRTRRGLGAEVEVWADVQKKHSSHAITGDLSITDLAKGASFCGADSLIVTGSSTGEPTSIADLSAVAKAGLPVVVGSGVCEQNIFEMAKHSDAVIVGSWLKFEGNWRNAVDQKRVRSLRSSLDQANS